MNVANENDLTIYHVDIGHVIDNRKQEKSNINRNLNLARSN